MFIVHHQSIR